MRAHGVLSQYKPQVEEASEPAILFLSSFDGSDGATSATDDSTFARTITFHNDAQLATAQKKFGSASLFIDEFGSGYLTIPHDATLDLGASPFTLEGFIRPASVLVSQVICGQADFAGTDVSWQITLSGANFQFIYTEDGTSYVQATNFAHGMSAGGAFYHWAVTRHTDDQLRCFIDGVLLATVDLTGVTFHNSSLAWGIGALSNGSLMCAGYHDEIRFLNYAEYTAGFTPPVAPFPRP